MNKKPVNGMRDIMPREMEIRAYVLGKIRETYRSFGYTEIETPVVESIENLTGKQGGENEKLTFKIMKRGEKLDIANAETELDLADSGLRYDLTMPLSRYYANHMAELPKPFKSLQIGPVFRAERPQKGRFREFYQCDIDILGDASNTCEIELILATTTALSRIGFQKFEILINDRRILKAMANFSGLKEEQYDDAFIALDKMDKIGEDGVKAELSALGMEAEAIEKYLSLFALGEGSSKERLLCMKEKLGETLSADVVENMTKILDTVAQAKTADFEVVFDPTLVRGMGYYTGPIFEIRVADFGSSVGGGGRYDEMIGKFAGQPVPAVGFSIGFERIISVLLDRGFQIPGAAEKTAFLLEKGLSAEKTAEALMKAAELRSAGKTVLVSRMIKNKKFQKEQLTAEGYAEILEFYERPLE